MIHAYVINLARSSERRAHVTAELEKTSIEYEIVEGVDGRDLNCADPQTIDPSVTGSSWFRPGVAGCALSHLRVHQKILADGRDHALVLEDDITVPGDLGKLADEVAEHLTRAEVALLNCDGRETLKMSRDGAVDVSSARKLALPIDVSRPESGAAYVITREACKRMTENVLPVRSKADDWGRFYREGMLDRVRCVVPVPVAKDPAFASTMDYYSCRSFKARTLALIERSRLRLLERAVVYRRQRIWRRFNRVEIVDEPFIFRPSRFDLIPTRRPPPPVRGTGLRNRSCCRRPGRKGRRARPTD